MWARVRSEIVVFDLHRLEVEQTGSHRSHTHPHVHGSHRTCLYMPCECRQDGRNSAAGRERLGLQPQLGRIGEVVVLVHFHWAMTLDPSYIIE